MKVIGILVTKEIITPNFTIPQTTYEVQEIVGDFYFTTKVYKLRQSFVEYLTIHKSLVQSYTPKEKVC